MNEAQNTSWKTFPQGLEFVFFFFVVYGLRKDDILLFHSNKIHIGYYIKKTFSGKHAKASEKHRTFFDIKSANFSNNVNLLVRFLV